MRNPIRWLLASFVVVVGLVFVGADRAEARFPSLYGAQYKAKKHTRHHPRHTSYHRGPEVVVAQPPLIPYPNYYRRDSYARPYVPYFSRYW